MSELLDNRRYRMNRLKAMIMRLHEGESPEALKVEFQSILDEVGPGELSALETQLMDEGLPQVEVQRMCDVHAALLGDMRPPEFQAAEISGHPLNTLKRENTRLREIVGEYRSVLSSLPKAAGKPLGDERIAAWRKVHEQLGLVEYHYQRKELLIFPYLEKAGIAGPPRVMWGVHDEIRERLKAVSELLESAADLDGAEMALVRDAVILPMLDQIESMTEKEDRILAPMVAEHASDGDWAEVAGQWRDLGPMLVEPQGVWLPVLAASPPPAAQVGPQEAIRMPSGHLNLEELVAVLNTLPMDVTFVDADDRVGFFSEGRDRIFARSRTIIGRRVQDCHPPKSLHIVEQVVDDLRSGRRDVAEFWIQMEGRFIHIRYFAVRSREGRYLGTLEVTQDVTGIRSLEGERRLLDETPAGRE